MESDCYSVVAHTEPGAFSQQGVGASTGQTCAYKLGSPVHGWPELERTGASVD
jgi:tRNA A37 threonylcarbamoyladenosine modification protein TsaB